MTESEAGGVAGPEESNGRTLAGVPMWLAAAIVTVAVLLLGFLALRMWSSEDIDIRGLSGQSVRSAAASDGAIEIRAESPEAMKVTIDGRPVRAEARPGALALRAPQLPDGPHQLQVDVPRSASWLGSSTTTRSFSVDNSPPELRVEDSLRPEGVGKPVTVTGSARDAAQVIVAGRPVVPDAHGAFSAVVERPEHDVVVSAIDQAGNRVDKNLTVHIRHPGMRAVHVTGMAWTSDALREPILAMAREGKIDTVELDLKDEDGEVTYDSQVPAVQQIGAAKNYYRAKPVLDQLHQMGVRVVGRLVAFKDPILGEASWRSGHPERVVQTAGGQPWTSGKYGSFAFTNFADPAVRQYNIDIAAEAAKLGFDDVLYDYVRRPDGPIEQMRFSGLSTTPEASVADFLRQTQTAVRSDGALLGASVFGISVNRPTQIAQDIRQMAQYVDYISPMVYPSHWGPGEFGVGNPNTQPYDIVQRSLAEFAKAVAGTDAQIIPWLQDFSLGASYGPAEVSAQLDAAKANGMPSFLLWAPNCRYHDQALAGPK